MVSFFDGRKEKKAKHKDPQVLAHSALQPTSTGQYARYFMSESRRAFGGEIGKAATIKNQQMDKFKFQYRNKAKVWVLLTKTMINKSLSELTTLFRIPGSRLRMKNREILGDVKKEWEKSEMTEVKVIVLLMSR